MYTSLEIVDPLPFPRKDSKIVVHMKLPCAIVAMSSKSDWQDQDNEQFAWLEEDFFASLYSSWAKSQGNEGFQTTRTITVSPSSTAFSKVYFKHLNFQLADPFDL